MSALGAALVICALLSALAVAARRRDGAPSERALVAALVWLSLVSPVVGQVGREPKNASIAIAIAIAVSVVLAIVAALVRVRFAEWFRELVRTVGQLLALPFRAVCATVRARSLAFFGVIFVLAGIWVVARATPRPSVLAWLGLATTTRSDLPNPGFLGALTRAISGAAIATAGYVLARRQRADRAEALGWGAVIALAPCALRLIRLDSVEIAPVALTLSATALAVRPTLRGFDAIVGLIALAVTASLHPWGFLGVLPVALAIFVLVIIARSRLGTARSVGIVAIGSVALTLAFVSARRIAAAQFHVGSPIDDLVTLWDIPLRAEPQSSGEGFGIGFAWVLLPVALIAIVFVVVDTITTLARRVKKLDREVRVFPWETVLVALALTLTTIFRTPPEIALIAATVVLGSWLATRLSAPRIAEGMIALNLLAAVTFHYWYGY